MNLCTINRSILKTALSFKISKFRYIGSFANNRSYSNFYDTVPRPKAVFGPGELDTYQSHFQDVVKYLTNYDKLIVPEIREYFKHILNYNVPGHEQASGPLVVLTYKYFASSEKQTLENIRLASILGWVNDMVANSFQILDDVLDSSQIRANKPCWYKNESVGFKAVQHASTIADGALIILNNFLSTHPNYIPIFELTTEVKYKTSMGKVLDLMNEGQIQNYTKEKYRIASIYRCSYLLLIHPVCMGMYLAGVKDQKLHAEVRAILDDIAVYFAAQNDIMDCYGKPEVTGKFGSNIQKGKSTWLSAQAMEDANPFQKELFQKYYGKIDFLSQEMILNLYKELEILEKFLIFKKESYKQMQDKIESMSQSIPKELIRRIVDVFYGKI